jgi:gamma-glutamyltranspeptidase
MFPECSLNVPFQTRLEALVLLQQQMEIEYALHMPVFANEKHLRFTLEEENLLKEIVSYIHHLKFEGHSVEDQLEMGRVAGGGTLHIVSHYMSQRVKAIRRG